MVLANEKSCRESLELARTVLPQVAEVTRSVVLVSGPAHVDFWAELLGTKADPDGVVVLRRHDMRGLRDWTQRHSFCETEERLARLSEVTGGWPVLLDKALKMRERHHDQDGVLLELADWLGQKSGAEWFVEAVSLLDDNTLKAAYFAVVDELGTERHGDAYLVTAAEMAGLPVDEARWAVSCLEALQVLERDGSQLGVEPVVHATLGVLGSGK